MSYRIVRMFRDGRSSFTVKSGLTLEQAQAHCKDPETSSSTCKSEEGLELAKEYGPWFDGYEESNKPKRSINTLKSPLGIWYV